ncbi:MAG: BamA/TamA family outer membrane protein [Chitinispirillaceae bacterium]|nr:BamA/TamA family outer membrane protein [Chitinispirillaceae bacterium]
MKLRIVFLLLIYFCYSDLSASSDTISDIIISGNRITKKETINLIAKIKKGIKFDSCEINLAKKRLKDSELFYKVEIFPIKSEEGYRVYIVLTEKIYFQLYDFGGELYSFKYGKKDLWWRLRVGTEYSNFRGKGEVLRTAFSIWDWRSLEGGWYKPFLTNPYYLSLWFSAHQLPDEVFEVDHAILRALFSIGRRLPFNSKTDITLMPMFRRRINYNKDLIILDTMHIYELFSILKWKTDYRNSSFDPKNGWMIFLDLRTNRLYSGDIPPFSQLFTEVRWYLRGISPNHTMAFRFNTLLRDRNAGITHRLVAGGEGSIRGYLRSEFGTSIIANNSLLFSFEYRLPLVYFPDMDLFWLTEYSKLFSQISSRLDGAFILDYGKLTEELPSLFQKAPSRVERGMGIGGGLRLHSTTFERSICFDLLWGINRKSPAGYIIFKKYPEWHLYIDMFF